MIKKISKAIMKKIKVFLTKMYKNIYKVFSQNFTIISLRLGRSLRRRKSSCNMATGTINFYFKAMVLWSNRTLMILFKSILAQTHRRFSMILSKDKDVPSSNSNTNSLILTFFFNSKNTFTVSTITKNPRDLKSSGVSPKIKPLKNISSKVSLRG